MASALITCAAAAALAYLLVYCHRPASWPKTAVKTVSVVALALAVAVSGAPVLLVLALVLCASGDYLLSRDSEPTFLAGVGAFAAGHVAYIALFLTTPGADFVHLKSGAYLSAIAVLFLYGVGMMTLLFHRAGALRFAVVGYVPIIIGMGVAAMTVPALGPLAWVLPAACLFMLSDSVLAAELFLLPEGHPAKRVTPFVIWASYWLAQLGFTLAYLQV